MPNKNQTSMLARVAMLVALGALPLATLAQSAFQTNLAITAQMSRKINQDTAARQAAYMLSAKLALQANGTYIAPAPYGMAQKAAYPTGTLSANGVGTVPTNIGAPTTADIGGSPLGYCVWANGSTTTGVGNVLSGPTTQNANTISMAVISPGADGVIQTTCDSTGSQVHQAGDDFVVKYTVGQLAAGFGGANSLAFGAPVADNNPGPTGGLNAAAANAITAGNALPDGQVRLVTSTNTLYRYTASSNTWSTLNGGASQWATGVTPNAAVTDITFATGSVAIGTTTTTGARLTVAGGGGILVNGNGPSGFNVATFVNDVGNNLVLGVGGSTAAGPNQNAAYVGTSGATPLLFDTNSLERMRIDPTGNVGIGTSTPTAKLEVAGNIRSGNIDLAGNIDPAGYALRGDATSLPILTLGWNRSGGLGEWNAIYSKGNGSPGGFVFRENLGGGSIVDRLRIDNVGNVSMAAGLYVGGTSNIAALNATAGNFSGLLTANGGLSATSANFSGLVAANAGIVGTTSTFGGATFGFQFVGNNIPTAYYKIATLPATSAGTYDNLNIEAVLNENWSSTSNRRVRLLMGNRNGFSARFTQEGGVSTPNVRLAAYAESDGTTSVYAVLISGAYTTLSGNVTSSMNAVTYRNPVGQSSVTGTVVFDTYTATPSYVIDGSNNFGIGGAPNPGVRLHVFDNSANAAVMSVVNQAANGASVAMYAAGSAGYGVGGWANAGIVEASGSGNGGLVMSAYSGPIIFQTNARTERMRIDSVGQVGIGGAPSNAMLDIYGNTGNFPITQAMIRVNNANSNAQSAIDFLNAGAFKGRIRSDSVGNLSMVANGGNFDWFSGGDAGTGVHTMGLSASGVLTVASFSATTMTANNFQTNAGEGNGHWLWDSSQNYGMSMGSTPSLYQYGPVTDYSIKMQMDSSSPQRGFTWGMKGQKPIAGLNQQGNFQIAGTFNAAGGNFTVAADGTTNVGRLVAGYDSGIAGSVNASGWFRSSGGSGWYNGTFGGGIWMQNGSDVEVFGSKNFRVGTGGGLLYSSNQINATGNQGSGIGTSNGALGGIMVQGDGTNAAFMSFHRPGNYAAYFGLDTDNQWAVGGWSMGATRYVLIHSGNIGSYAVGLGNANNFTNTNNFAAGISINNSGNAITNSGGSGGAANNTNGLWKFTTTSNPLSTSLAQYTFCRTVACDSFASPIVFRADGNVQAVGFVSTSDRRFKTNIVSIDPATLRSNFMAARPVSYNWISNGQAQTGYIAQELQPLFPWMVSQLDDEGHLGVTYTQMIPIIHAVVQMHEKEIEALQSGKLDNTTGKWIASSDKKERLYFEDGGKTVLRGHGDIALEVRNADDQAVATFRRNGNMDVAGIINFTGAVQGGFAFNPTGTLVSSKTPGEIIIASSQTMRAAVRLQHSAAGSDMASGRVFGLLFGDETGVGLSDASGKALLTANTDATGASSVKVSGTLIVGDGQVSSVRLGGDTGITASGDGSLQLEASNGVRIYNPKTKETVISLGSDGTVQARRFVPTDVVMQNAGCDTALVGAIARDSNGQPMVCAK